MRILEESAQTDNSGKIVNGMNGLNLTDMTFHEVAMTIKERRMDGKEIVLQVTKKIGQVLGGSGDAGACHQLVNHLVQLGYKVKPTFSLILEEHHSVKIVFLLCWVSRFPRALTVRREQSCSRPAMSSIG